MIALAATAGACSSDDAARPSSPTTLPSAVRFTDVTQTSGISTSYATVADSAQVCGGGARLREHFAELVGAPSESLDVDLCQNERMAASVAIGDYDGDGRPDLYVTRVDEPGRLFRQVAALRFEDVTNVVGLGTLSEPSSAAAFLDVDNDADLDLFVSTMSSRANALFINDGHGTFRDEADARGVALRNGSPHMGMSIAVGDYDRDGYVDVFTTEWRSPYVAPDDPYNARLLHNSGPAKPGYFEDVTEPAGVSMERVANPAWSFGAHFADLDNDGWQDLAVVSDYQTSRLFWNQRDGTFVDGTTDAGVGTDENGMGSTITDIDGDGFADWFVSGIYSAKDFCAETGCAFGRTGNRLYRNNGDRTFTDSTDRAGVRDAAWGWGAALFDATNSGSNDLVVLGGYEFSVFEEFTQFANQRARFWSGTSDGSFVSVRRSGIDVTDGKGVAVADLDGDGDLDLVTTRPGAAMQLFRNDAPNRGHFVRVTVAGSESNREGLGAVVTVTRRGGGPRQRREVGSVTATFGQSERTVHIGLGRDGGNVDEIRVEFPKSGRVIVLHDVAVDSELTVDERDAQ